MRTDHVCFSRCARGPVSLLLPKGTGVGAGLVVFDRIAQLGERLRGADEETRRNPPRLHQLRIYLFLGILVETHSGQVLQAQVAIRVDGGAL